MSEEHAHFKGKAPLDHVVEVQARGMIASTESHSPIMPGHLSAAADSAKETAFILLILWTVTQHYSLAFSEQITVLLTFCIGWLIWKAGRIAWLNWQHIERLNRMMEEERWEIEHNREQEREELSFLYKAKGFHGKLLEDVIDVLMADDDRLLKVMLEEELGLQLECLQHPLITSIGAAIGVLLSAVLCFSSILIHPQYGIIVSSLLTLAFGSAFSAYYQGNNIIRALVWNLGIGTLAFSSSFFLFQHLRTLAL
jgi:hypothetical protein